MTRLKCNGICGIGMLLMISSSPTVKEFSQLVNIILSEELRVD